MSTQKKSENFNIKAVFISHENDFQKTFSPFVGVQGDELTVKLEVFCYYNYKGGLWRLGPKDKWIKAQ